MIRLRFFLERIGMRRVLMGALVLVVLVAAGVVAAIVFGGGGKKAAPTTAASTPDYTNLFYLRALAPKVRVQRCTMFVRFIWKPNYHADQYIDAPALIQASGTDIEGTYRKTFKASGVSLDVGPIALGGGYKVWSAKVLSLDRDPPGNDTTIQTATPTAAKCG